MVRTHCPSRQGFKVIELLAVIVIIATLATLIVPAINQARVPALRATTGCHLRQIGLALINRESATKSFPLGFDSATGKSFYYEIREEIEANTFCDSAGGNAQPFSSFLCPARHTAASVQPGMAPADYGYALDFGEYRTILGGQAPVSADDVKDGASNTILVTVIGMTPASYRTGLGPWPTTNYGRTVGGDPPLKADAQNPGGQGFGSPFKSSMPAVYAEGHVGMLDYSLTTTADFLRMWGYSDGEDLEQAQ